MKPTPPLLLALALMSSALLMGCDPETGPGTEDAGMRDASGVCGADSVCGGTFCAPARCDPSSPSADSRGCVPGTAPCGADERCVEASASCVSIDCSTDGDLDGDGHSSMACGGDDCDDEDSNRFPGNVEVCDLHDEDCDPTTYGGTDLDGDGFESAACCNGDACGADCDDTRRDVHPDATDLCNTIDDDCDGSVDGPGAFCPSGACVESRCRAGNWMRSFGSVAYDEAAAVVADAVGRVLVYATLGGPATVAGDALPAGRHLLGYDVEGRPSYTIADIDATRIELNTAGDELALIGLTEVRMIATADGAERRTWTHPALGGGAGDAGLLTVLSSAARDRIGLVGYHTGAAAGVLIRRVGWDGAIEAERNIPTASTVEERAIDLHADGSVVVSFYVGTPTDVGLGGTEGPGTVLLYLDSAFEPQWAWTLSDAAAQAVDIGDDAVAYGFTHRSTLTLPWGGSAPHAASVDDDGMVVVFERSDGAHRWTMRHGGPGRDSFEVTEFDGRGGLVVGGRFSGTFDVGIALWTAVGPQDGYVLTLDAATGVTLDGTLYSGPGLEAVVSLTVDTFGASVIGGVFTDTASLAGFATTSRGGYDGFVVRVAE